ncbi:tetratricopeptide repeat protein [Rhodoflexus caldus]|uniref:tetratricopeptide repeat protein n=1 Tax=Rhodoflexus caldus TaxID=2891236 RepID=UPI00202ABE55|nr:tetratricopeptide repeat protein [Rhodoflexus caldus]
MKTFTYLTVFPAIVMLLWACGNSDEQFAAKARELLGKQDYEGVVQLLAPRKASLSDADAVNMLGYAYMELRQTDSAMTCFNQAIKLNNQNYKYFYNRGNAFWQMGMPEEALKDFDRALELDQTVYELYLNRGAMLAAMGRHKEAIADFNRAADMNKSDRNIFFNRAQSRLALKEFDKASEDLQYCTEIAPDFARAYYMLGLVIYSQLPADAKNDPKGCEYLQKAVNLGMPEARDLLYEKCSR